MDIKAEIEKVVEKIRDRKGKCISVAEEVFAEPP